MPETSLQPPGPQLCGMGEVCLTAAGDQCCPDMGLMAGKNGSDVSRLEITYPLKTKQNSSSTVMACVLAIPCSMIDLLLLHIQNVQIFHVTKRSSGLYLGIGLKGDNSAFRSWVKGLLIILILRLRNQLLSCFSSSLLQHRIIGSQNHRIV